MQLKLQRNSEPCQLLECSQNPSQEIDSIYSTSISSTSNGSKARISASSQITPRKKDSEFSLSTFSSTSFRAAKGADAKIPRRTFSNCSSRDASPSTNTSLPLKSAIIDLHTVKKVNDIPIPVSVPRNHVSHETTSSSRAANSNADSLSCDVSSSPSHVTRFLDHACKGLSQSIGVEIGPSRGISSNWDRGNSSSKQRQVGTVEKPAAGDASSTSTRYVTEKFERIMPPDHASTIENDKCEELASSSNDNGGVKYVRGVAVPLGKTRSLVERFEKRESFGRSAAKGPSRCSGREMELEDDSPICDHLLQTHDTIINALKSRLTKLQVVRHFWEFNGIKAAVDATVKLPDHSVQVDLVSVLRGKLDSLSLDVFVCLLPLLLGLVNSKTERHITVSLEMLCELVKVFGPVVASTISMVSSVGVDLHAEERFQRSKQCHKYFERIKQILPSVIRRGGLPAKHAQELNMLFRAS